MFKKKNVTMTSGFLAYSCGPEVLKLAYNGAVPLRFAMEGVSAQLHLGDADVLSPFHLKAPAGFE